MVPGIPKPTPLQWLANIVPPNLQRLKSLLKKHEESNNPDLRRPSLSRLRRKAPNDYHSSQPTSRKELLYKRSIDDSYGLDLFSQFSRMETGKYRFDLPRGMDTYSKLYTNSKFTVPALKELKIWKNWQWTDLGLEWTESICLEQLLRFITQRRVRRPDINFVANAPNVPN